MRVLRACSAEFPCKPFTKSARFCSVSGTRLTVLVVYTPNSFAKTCWSDSVVLPSHTPRTNLASARPCLIPSRIFPPGDTATRNSAASAKLHHLSFVRFPKAIFKRCLLVALHVIHFKQPSIVSHQPRPHIHGGRHFDRESCFQLETQASNLTFHSVVCSPNCTIALAAESWSCLNFELNSVCACSHCDLVCQLSQRWFWINFQNCFRVRHPFDECSAHR